MEKYRGNIGFAETVEVTRGQHKPVTTERKYRGEMERNSFRLSSPDKVNGDLVLVNTLTIVADAYLSAHFNSIRYVEWLGSKWKVSSVAVDRPKITITLGEVWNGDDE